MAQYIDRCVDLKEFLVQKKVESPAKTWVPGFLDNIIVMCEKAGLLGLDPLKRAN